MRIVQGEEAAVLKGVKVVVGARFGCDMRNGVAERAGTREVLEATVYHLRDLPNRLYVAGVCLHQLCLQRRQC